MNIGQAAAASGLSSKMIRHYESIGLLAACERSDSGYRQYNNTQVHQLRFIRRARDLGFSLEQIRELLSLWQNRSRASSDVKQVALQHIAELNQRITELTGMRNTLQTLADACCGNNQPACPILEELQHS